MLMLLSPAKSMNFDPTPAVPEPTMPLFTPEATALVGACRKLTVKKLTKLMDISEALATLNHERFQSFRGDGRANGQKPALLAFSGDVYLGLNAGTMTAADLAFAQQRLRILSGLYGLLRPLDAIEPYRLEMGSKIKPPKAKSLYAYWGDKIALAINAAVADHADPTIVNLASNEYFAAADRPALNGPVVSAVFKEEKDGKQRQLQFFAKRARGLMARWAIDNRIDRVDGLKDFSIEGYRFNKKGSTDAAWLFTRPQPASPAAARAAADSAPEAAA